MTQYEIQNRYREFEEPIRDLAMDHPIVKRIIDMYAHGDIMCYEEAMCRMVVELARANSTYSNNHIKHMMTFVEPLMRVPITRPEEH